MRGEPGEKETKMGDKRPAATSGGSGLLIAGGVLAGLIVAAVYLTQRSDGQLDAAARSALSALSDRPLVQNAVPDLAARGAVEAQSTQTRAAPETSLDESDTADPPADTADALPVVTPTVDEVRVEAGGLMVVAGRAEPGARVEVVVDGEVVSEARADARGAFAALGTVAPSATAQALSLRAGEGDAETESDAEIILAPVVSTAPAPVTADATPPAQPAQDDLAIGSARPATPPQPLAPPEQQEPGSLARAPEAGTRQIALLRSDATGVSRIQTVPTRNVVLDTIGYSSDGVVQLGGRAGSGAVTVRAYLNNVPVARLTVSADGSWRGDVQDVEAGIYTLRIDALSADGMVTSRVETPFQREAPEALIAAENASGPASAVTVQAGDTLWAIARDRYGEGTLFVQVFEANRAAIRDPDLIYPGQVFDLPAE